MLVGKELLSEVKNVHLDKCVDYLAGKQNMVSFCSRPPMRKKNALELVHTDVCQVDAKSYVGTQYFVTLIDDYSRTLWASVLKTMDQVLYIFRELEARAERESE